MPRNHHFSFKEFTIRQELSAMKVCTDACLFGAWADITHARDILDIGTGTGLLSLMVAQRNPLAAITGVEIEKDAYEQTGRNFAESDFSARLTVRHTPVQLFFPDKKFDSIVCNPPFFQNDLRSPDKKMNTAHHAETLTLTELHNAVERLLQPGGSFHLMLPVAESRIFEAHNSADKWILKRELLLAHRPGVPPFRRMISFLFSPGGEMSPAQACQETLYIYDDKGVNYTSAFKEYLKAFYLGF